MRKRMGQMNDVKGRGASEEEVTGKEGEVAEDVKREKETMGNEVG